MMAAHPRPQRPEAAPSGPAECTAAAGPRARAGAQLANGAVSSVAVAFALQFALAEPAAALWDAQAAAALAEPTTAFTYAPVAPPSIALSADAASSLNLADAKSDKAKAKKAAETRKKAEAKKAAAEKKKAIEAKKKAAAAAKVRCATDAARGRAPRSVSEGARACATAARVVAG